VRGYDNFKVGPMKIKTQIKLQTKLLAAILLLSFSQNILGDVLAAEKPNSFYLWRNVGEIKTPVHAGIMSPMVFKHSNEVKPLNEDDQYIQSLVRSNIQDYPLTLSQFWFDDVMEESLCPNSELAENLEYIRYLYRLVTISYSFESLKRLKKINDQLGLNQKNCSTMYADLFGQCKPTSEEMKKFHQRVYGKFVNEIEKIKYEKYNSKEVESWWKEFHRSIALSLDPVASRINDKCFADKMSCRDLKNEDLAKFVGQICLEDRTLIQDLCQEKDDLNGVSNSEKLSELIRQSNAFNLINKNGYGEDCLRRFAKISQNKERKYPHLAKLIPLMHSQLVKEKNRYPQGDLFLPGALKEFDVKGLSDFLVALQPPKPKPIIKVKPKPKPIEKKPEPVVVVVEKPKEIPVEVPVIVEPPKPKVSEFERALGDLKKFNSTRSEIDMDTFRSDFEFTPEQYSALEIPLKRFQTRAALVDMKTYDKMGSKESPIGLMFIKFLIDSDNHQGLYNIQAIIGEKFFVINDFESKVEPVAVELKNDSSTKNRWALTILKNL
jgi:hypothetical protein